MKELLAQAIDSLSRDKERELFKNGDRDTLFRSMIRYGIKISRKYHGKGMDEDDYAQIAMLGILEAIDTFDVTRGTRLMTHVAWRIRNVVLDVIRKQGDLIRTPCNCIRPNIPKTIMSFPENFDVEEKEKQIPKEPLWFISLLTNRERKIIEYRFYREMSLDEIAGRIHVSREWIRQILAAIFRRVRHAEASEFRKDAFLSYREPLDKC